MSEASKNLPRDTFLYLAAIITLVVVAVGFGMAVFNYIDFYFPDPATDYYRSASSYEGAIRQAMAMLIVVFPVFYWVSRFLRRDVDAHPEKRELKIRKWLLYLTLFAAALVIIGDFVTVVNNFLRGELTTRFTLKALTIFFISGSIFYYYLAQLNSSNRQDLLKQVLPVRARWINLFSLIIVAVVIAAVGWGFAVIGSPFEQRDKRFDERRVQDLSMIQNYITNYWQNKEVLPVNLSDLEDPLLGIVIPADPETGGPYEYRVVGDLTFELCATFKTQDEGDQRAIPQIYPPRSQDYNWQHGAGRTCFERTIDPDFFQIEKPRPL